jgi:NAD(P)H dehydrogenase (quinone)
LTFGYYETKHYPKSTSGRTSREKTMKSLIVLAHPEPKSFNASLAEAAEKTLKRGGGEVRISNLYEREFDPSEHAGHFSRYKNPTRFDAQTEQRFSADEHILPADVQKEIDDLLWADFVLLQFPLWWFGMPAILKGWMDRVFVYGKMYSGSRRFHTGVCSGKRAMLAVTAGSSAGACSPRGQEGDTRLILWPAHYSLHYLGFTVLEPALMTGVRGGYSGDDAVNQDLYLTRLIDSYTERLANLETSPIIPFNRPEDWGADRRLKPGAPVYSPFIHHG